MKSIAQRRITLVRHAKAVPDEAAPGDHARPLNERGRGDAQMLGSWLREQGLQPDMVYCSNSVRTQETLALLGLKSPHTISEKLYLASPGEMLTLLQQADDGHKHIMLIGHNPGMHGLVALLTESYAREEDADAVLAKFPTSATASMTLPLAQWKQLAPQSARLDLLRMGKSDH